MFLIRGTTQRKIKCECGVAQLKQQTQRNNEDAEFVDGVCCV
jgi:hypothetical protein